MEETKALAILFKIGIIGIVLVFIISGICAYFGINFAIAFVFSIAGLMVFMGCATCYLSDKLNVNNVDKSNYHRIDMDLKTKCPKIYEELELNHNTRNTLFKMDVPFK